MIPDFGEFLAYAASREEDFDSTDLVDIFSFDELTPENFCAIMNAYSDSVTKIAAKVALTYLRLYHEWLQQQT